MLRARTGEHLTMDNSKDVFSKPHAYRVGTNVYVEDNAPEEKEIEGHRSLIEPWLSAVLQTEHLGLLLGSGFTTAVGFAAKASATGMEATSFSTDFQDKIEAYAKESARRCGRGQENIEDHIRATLSLLDGLRVLQDERADKLEAELDGLLRDFLRSLLETEQEILKGIEDSTLEAKRLLVSFLLTFSSRAASRERLNIFTTNYDRLIEFGCDLAGLRTIDRFVGALTPVFRSSRIEVDYHYNPPGIRGEPRYLEGVVHLAKLHGSLDWRWGGEELRRFAVPFGADKSHPDVLSSPASSIMIYPNPAKDVETLYFPYADLFRDFSASLCRPNTSLIVFGYGFGDDHINRVLKDMLSIPSTHLVIMSFDHASGRLPAFCESVGRPAQLSLLVGPHFGNLDTLVTSYLPKPAIDPISWRRSELLKRRGVTIEEHDGSSGGSDDNSN